MRNRFAFLVVAYFAAASGCVYHSGYYPYGYGNGYNAGPSVLPAQPYPTQPMYPSGPIYQPGGAYPAPMGPTYPTTPTTAPLQPDTNPPSTYGNPGGAPTFNPDAPGGVPRPGDENNTNYNPTTNSGPLITPTSGAKVSDELSSPFDQESTRLPRNFDDQSTTEAEPFEPPVTQTSGSADGNVEFANLQAAAPATKIYGRDPSPRFEWVQGIVEYDEASKIWVIMYDDNPKPSDQLGGELALVDNPALARLRAGDAYRIEGSIDRSELDARGKPMYLVARFQRLQNR